MIIDCHGHYTTVPAAMRVFRAQQISAMGRPKKSAVTISDDEIRTSLEKGQIRLLDERGIDVILFSPMASAMGHHFGSETITRRTRSAPTRVWSPFSPRARPALTRRDNPTTVRFFSGGGADCLKKSWPP